MNLEQIKLFIAVYKARSFAAVAKDINVAPSSVSRAIAALEDQLQTRLFQRTTRSLAPTQLGEQYFHRVEALFDELELAHQELIHQQSEPFGTLKVTASTSYGQAVLAPLLGGFHQQFPKIRLELNLADTQANLIEDQFDLAIRHGRLNDSNLIARKLQDVRYRLVGHPNRIKNGPAVKHPEDILKHPLVSFGYHPFDKAWQFRHNSNGKKDPKYNRTEQDQTIQIQPILTTTTASALKACALNQMGLALLPDWIIQEELESNELVNLLPEWEIAGTDFKSAIWMVYPTRQFVPEKTRVFMEYLIGKV